MTATAGLSRVDAQYAAGPAWPLYTAGISHLRLLRRDVAGVVFNGSGQTGSGLLVSYAQHLYPTLFRVLAVGPRCTILRVGDLVRVRPHVWDDVDIEDPPVHLKVMDERRAIYRLEGTPR